MTAIGRIVVGVIALTLGRKLFWLFVGAVGFVLGMALATRYLQGQPDWLILVIALGVGLLGALLAVFVQKVAIALAGFIGGGYILINLLNMLGWEAGRLGWVAFIVGGIIGVVLITVLFDWALIIISSLTGSGLIVDAIQLGSRIEVVVFVVLLLLGIAIQGGWMRRRRRKSAPPAKA
jgi:hypothetical protein